MRRPQNGFSLPLLEGRPQTHRVWIPHDGLGKNFQNFLFEYLPLVCYLKDHKLNLPDSKTKSGYFPQVESEALLNLNSAP